MNVVLNLLYPGVAPPLSNLPSPQGTEKIPDSVNCRSCVFLNVHDIRHGAHQYGKDWVPFGLLAASPVSGLWLLFTRDLIDYGFFKRDNVSNPS